MKLSIEKHGKLGKIYRFFDIYKRRKKFLNHITILKILLKDLSFIKKIIILNLGKNDIIIQGGHLWNILIIF
jgi:hypothetical protein